MFLPAGLGLAEVFNGRGNSAQCLTRVECRPPGERGYFPSSGQDYVVAAPRSVHGLLHVEPGLGEAADVPRFVDGHAVGGRFCRQTGQCEDVARQWNNEACPSGELDLAYRNRKALRPAH